MPDAVLRFSPDTQGALDSYTLDFSVWLSTQPGDTITLASVTVAPAGMTLVGAATVSGGFVTQVLSGGTLQTDYQISYHVTTAFGRSVTRIALLYCGTAPVDTADMVATLGERALRRLGITIVPVADRQALTAIVTVGDLATRALLHLAVIDAEDPSPSAADQAYAVTKVQSVHDSLVAQGFVPWTSAEIPQAVAEDYVVLASLFIAPAFGKQGDVAQLPVLEQRIKRVGVIMGAPEAAYQAVLSVHQDLVARGKVRWSVFDLPVACQDPYTYLGAYQLAPLFGMKPNDNDRQEAERALARYIMLPSSEEHVRAEYF